jgi:RNA polymerase sigma factor (sigma-70 family)
MDPDTLIGGNQQKFPQTNHSAIVAARSSDDQVRQRAFESILSSYWKPAYKYVRIKWNMGNEDAKDLTQGFFADAFEKNHIAGYDATKASFQTFLRTCIDGFVSNWRKSQSRLKRGGSFEHLHLDFNDAESEILAHAAPDDLSPEQYFHREWIRNLFSQAVLTLRQRYQSSGREVQFRLFELYDLEDHSGASKTSYATLATQFSLTPITVTNYLSAARRDFKRVVLDKLREITATDEEFRREARELLGVDLR